MDGYIFYTDGSYGRNNEQYGTCGFIGYKYTKGDSNVKLPRGLYVTNKGFCNINSEPNAKKVKLIDFYGYAKKENYEFSYRAEITAILNVLLFLKEFIEDKAEVLIKSDCQSAVLKITNMVNTGVLTHEKFDEITEIVSIINEFNKRKIKVDLTFIPGHSGIYGNELADRVCSILYTNNLMDTKPLVIKASKLNTKIAIPEFLNFDCIYGTISEPDKLYVIKEDPTNKNGCYQMCVKIGHYLEDNYLQDLKIENTNDVITYLLKLAINRYVTRAKNKFGYFSLHPKVLLSLDNLIMFTIFGDISYISNNGVRAFDKNGLVMHSSPPKVIKDLINYVVDTTCVKDEKSYPQHYHMLDITEDVKKQYKKKIITIDLTNNEILRDKVILDSNDFVRDNLITYLFSKKEKYSINLVLIPQGDFIRYFVIMTDHKSGVYWVIINKYTNVVYSKKK